MSESKPAIQDDEPGGVPEWVVTYGDMMSLLLTFFIMLVSMSQLKDEGNVRMMLDAIREAFGATNGSSGSPGPSPLSRSKFNKPGSTGRTAVGGSMRASRDSRGLAGPHESVQRVNHGAVVSLGGPAYFERFSAALTDETRASLEIIADVVREKPHRLVIRGHASPEPLPADPPFLDVLGRPAADALDLSYARAHAVADHFVALGIDRDRVVISAAGDAEPRTLTRQADQQQWNRRVDVFLIDSYITRPQPPGPR